MLLVAAEEDKALQGLTSQANKEQLATAWSNYEGSFGKREARASLPSMPLEQAARPDPAAFTASASIDDWVSPAKAPKPQAPHQAETKSLKKVSRMAAWYLCHASAHPPSNRSSRIPLQMK